MSERRSLNTKIGALTLEGMQAFADEHSVTVTALVEAFGRHLGNGTLPPNLEELVLQARAVDVENRRRRRGPN